MYKRQSLRNRASAILLRLIVCSSTVSTLIFINKGQHDCFTQSPGTQTCAALDLLALPCFTRPSARYYALLQPGQQSCLPSPYPLDDTYPYQIRPDAQPLLKCLPGMSSCLPSLPPSLTKPYAHHTLCLSAAIPCPVFGGGSLPCPQQWACNHTQSPLTATPHCESPCLL